MPEVAGNSRKHSWLGRVSLYVGKLEDDLARLEERERELLNRLVEITTGRPLGSTPEDDLKPAEPVEPRNLYAWAVDKEAESLEAYEQRIHSEAEAAKGIDDLQATARAGGLAPHGSDTGSDE